MIIKYNLEDLHSTAQKIIDFLKENKQYKIIAFDGAMGTGKTTLIKEICSIFEVKEEEITSPTFAIINEYKSETNNFIYHFDFYRLKNIQEAIDIGTEDYFYSGFYCFIEWPDVILSLLPEKTLFIKLEIIDNENRKIEILNTKK